MRRRQSGYAINLCYHDNIIRAKPMSSLSLALQTIKKQEEMLFVRGEWVERKGGRRSSLWADDGESILGDSVVLISPQA